jgi:hypothetical protein
MALVVKHFYADSKPNENGNYVEIAARESGLITWFLALIKIDPTYMMFVSYNEVMYQSSNFTGYKKIRVTTGSISSSFYGYYKPWKAAATIFSLFFMASIGIGQAGSIMTALITLLVGFLIAAVYYFLNKELLIGFSEVNGDRYSMVIKRSVIENKEISEVQLKLVTEIISTILKENRNLGKVGSTAQVNQ